MRDCGAAGRTPQLTALIEALTTLRRGPEPRIGQGSVNEGGQGIVAIRGVAVAAGLLLAACGS